MLSLSYPANKNNRTGSAISLIVIIRLYNFYVHFATKQKNRRKGGFIFNLFRHNDTLFFVFRFSAFTAFSIFRESPKETKLGNNAKVIQKQALEKSSKVV